MKVLLVRPPSIMGREHAHALQHPINLCYLAAAVRECGARPAIIDYEVVPFSTDAFRREVAAVGPSVIGFTAMTPSVDAVAEMAAAAKKTLPAVVTVLGGPHASILPVETLERYSQFDAMVMGEGETAFSELCGAVGSDGLSSREIASVIIRNGAELMGDSERRAAPLDLSRLPLPARDLLDLGRYGGAPTPGLPQKVFRATQLFTSRGCPGKCTFCCSEHIFGRRVRHRPIGHILDEIRDCIGRFGFKHFTIDNDTFTDDRERVMEFCGAVGGLGITWDCDTRVDRVDEELLRGMAKAGCVKVAFGVESGSPRVLKWIKKGITVEQIRDAFRWTRRAGMLSCGFFMIGNHPDEAEADIAETRRLIREIDPDLITIAISTPYPKTEFHRIMREAGLLEDLPWSDYGRSFQGEPVTRTKTISAARLKALQTKLLRGFYLRPSYILRRLSRVRNVNEALYWFGAGGQFLLYMLRRAFKAPRT